MEWFALHIFPSFFFKYYQQIYVGNYYNEFNELIKKKKFKNEKKKGIYDKNFLSQCPSVKLHNFFFNELNEHNT